MTRYHYTFEESDHATKVTIYEKDAVAATATYFPTRDDFEAYSVTKRFQGRKLSYALTHLLLLYCKDNRRREPQVSNAHNALLKVLPQVGFDQDGEVRLIKGKKEAAASFRCANIDRSLELCKAKMLEAGLIRDGLRLSGEYRWRTLF